MTDTTEPTTPDAETPAETPQETDQATNSNREAAKYRKQLREAESERDAAHALIADARRELLAAKLPQVEHVIGEGNSTCRVGHLRPEALDDAGIELDALFDGMSINEDKLRAELTRVYETKPYLFIPPRMHVPNIEKSPDMSLYGNTFTEAFAPKR